MIIIKALVLFSGGLDSTTLLAKTVAQYGADQVLALSITYGQKHHKEIQAAEKIAQHYGVEQRFLDLQAIFANSTCSLLSHSQEELPRGSYADQQRQEGDAPVATYVPFRNGLFLSAAASMALSEDCEAIYYGAHHDDWAGNAYPDCSVEFVQAMNQAIVIGTGNQLRLEAPFLHASKSQIVAEGLALAVPYELTWSCYEGAEQACGSCATCVDRLRAFAQNSATDPINYQQEVNLWAAETMKN